MTERSGLAIRPHNGLAILFRRQSLPLGVGRAFFHGRCQPNPLDGADSAEAVAADDKAALFLGLGTWLLCFRHVGSVAHSGQIRTSVIPLSGKTDMRRPGACL